MIEILIALSRYLLSCKTEQMFLSFVLSYLSRWYFGRRRNLIICPINKQNFIFMDKDLVVFFKYKYQFKFS